MEPATRRFLLLRTGAGSTSSLTGEKLRSAVEVPTVEVNAFVDLSVELFAIADQRRILGGISCLLVTLSYI